MRKRFRRLNRQPPELDITAFLNLMVILIPFLLITAVFSQTNILEMNLPTQSDETVTPPEKPPLQLELILRKDSLQIGDQPGRVLKTLPKQGEHYNLAEAQALLKTIKSRFPDETTATLLLEAEVPYNDLVEVMDAVRLYERKQDNKTVQVELFPDVALGDAPPAKGPNKHEEFRRARRMAAHHKRTRRNAALNLVSLMDIFTILVFFLLVNSSDVDVMPNAKSIELPKSVAEQKPKETLFIIVNADTLLVQGRQIANVNEVLASEENIIDSLKQELEYQASKSLVAVEEEERREITILGDKNIPYRLLKKIMITCNTVNYNNISLAVSKKFNKES